jgi:hypothetical protein
MKDHSVDLFYSATHKESGRKVTLKVLAEINNFDIVNPSLWAMWSSI